METQTVINAALGGFSFLAGFILKAVWDGLKELRAADSLLADKVQRIEILVAGSYVTWDGMKDYLRPLSVQLDRIEQKLDGKMDKVHHQ